MSKIQKATDRIQADARDALEVAWKPSSEIPWHSADVIAPLRRKLFRRQALIDLAQNAGVGLGVINEGPQRRRGRRL
jgi:hypothetical protein